MRMRLMETCFDCFPAEQGYVTQHDDANCVGCPKSLGVARIRSNETAAFSYLRNQD